jgi:hypothetical protein
MDFPSREVWRKTVAQLWRVAKYHEERCAAIALAGEKRAAAFQSPPEIPLYEEIIVTGGWDYVDDVASRRSGRYCETIECRCVRRC